MPDGSAIDQSSHADPGQSSRSTTRGWTLAGSNARGSWGTRKGQMSSRPRNCFARCSSVSSAWSRRCLASCEVDLIQRHVPVCVEDLESALFLLLELHLIWIEPFDDRVLIRG